MTLGFEQIRCPLQSFAASSVSGGFRDMYLTYPWYYIQTVTIPNFLTTTCTLVVMRGD